MSRDGLFASPSFRAHLLWAAGGFTAALLGIVAAALFIPLFQRFDAGVATPDELMRLTGEILEVHARYWPVAAIAFLATLSATWWLHGRMRSPLVRFVVAFRAVARGEVPETLVIRATDYVQEECAAINALLADLRARREREGRALAALEERVAELAEWSARAGDARGAELAAALEADCKALAEARRA